MRKHFFYEERLLNFENDETQYWLGFIYADGYIDKYFIRLYLSEKDKEHLEKFLKFIESDDYIRYEKSLNRFSSLGACWIKVSSINLVKKLKEKGFDKKSFILNEVLLFSPHFWRGVIDGDGTLFFGFVNRKSKNGKIYKVGNFRIVLYGFKQVLEQFKLFAENFMENIKIQMYRRKTKSYNYEDFLEAHVCNKKAFLLMKNLYENASIYLPRKKEIFDKAQQYYERESWFLFKKSKDDGSQILE